MMQHVNHAQYVVWAETIRARYLAEVVRTDIRGSKGGILARLVVDYKRQLDYREPVAVGCRVSRLGTKSFDMIHEIWSERAQETAAVVTGTMVAFDYRANESIAIPEEWRLLIRSFEILSVEGA